MAQAAQDRPQHRRRDWRRIELEYKARLPWRLIRRRHELGPDKLLLRARTHAWHRERLTENEVSEIANRVSRHPNLSLSGLPNIGPPAPYPPGSYFVRKDVEAFLTAQLSILVLEQRMAVAR